METKSRIMTILAATLLVMGPITAHGDETTDKGQRNASYLKKEGGYWIELNEDRDVLGIHDLGFGLSADGRISSDSGLFAPYVAYPTGSWPEAVAIGDVNSDGRNDVVMTTSFYFDPENDYHVHVFLQSPGGELEPPVKYPTLSSYSNRPVSVDVGDLNNDGRADVVVGNSGSNIEVFLQNGSGGLDLGVVYPTNNASKIRIGDFNNDGLFDVASIGSSTHEVDVFLQNREGGLHPPVTYAVFYGGYNDLDVGDVNDDGLTDVIVMSGQLYTYDNIGVLLQGADGTFGPAIYYDMGGDEHTHGVAVGDTNGDNLHDIVVSYGGNRPGSHIAAFLQNDSGTLNSPISYASYDIPEPVEIADVNLDGRNDVIVLHGGWSAMGVYLQDEGGGLLPYELDPIPYASHYNPHGLAIGDINGDGAGDVAIADYNNGLVILYSKLSAPEPPPGRYSLTARVYIDYRCDHHYRRGMDKPLANVPVTIRFSNGASITKETERTGLAYFYGFDPSDGITVTTALPERYKGYLLEFCGNAYERYELDSGDFPSFRHKYVEFRAEIVTR